MPTGPAGTSRTPGALALRSSSQLLNSRGIRRILPAVCTTSEPAMATTGANLIPEKGRLAAIYVFAWHGGWNDDTTDHRDESQWEYYVIPTQDLPPKQKTIALSRIGRLAPSVIASELAHTVDAIEARMPAPVVGGTHFPAGTLFAGVPDLSRKHSGVEGVPDKGKGAGEPARSRHGSDPQAPSA